MNKEQLALRFDMQAEGEEAEVQIYSVIDSEKWWGDETTPTDFDKALKAAKEKGAKRLNLRVNSPGGDVYSAVAMRSMIINSCFDGVRVMIEGLCASAATLFATIPEAHVVIAEGSEFMIHNPMCVAWGNSKEMQETVDHLHKLEEQFHGMYAARTGQTEDRIKDWMDATTWFTAKEAVKYGFCDEMLEAENQREGRAVACVTPRIMALMKSAYKAVPEAVTVREEMPADNNGSNDSSVAGETSVNTTKEGNPNMEIKDITREQLLEENPALADDIASRAVAAERQRIKDIMDTVQPGYEQMAEQAIQDGTDAAAFMRNMLMQSKQKGKEYLQIRAKETEPAKDIAGSAAEDEPKNNDRAEEDAAAKEVAKYATDMANAGTGMF